MVDAAERAGRSGCAALGNLKVFPDNCKLFMLIALTFSHRRPPGESEGEAGSGVDAAEQGWETLGALDLGGSSLEVTFMPLGRPAAEAEGAL